MLIIIISSIINIVTKLKLVSRLAENICNYVSISHSCLIPVVLVKSVHWTTSTILEFTGATGHV